MAAVKKKHTGHGDPDDVNETDTTLKTISDTTKDIFIELQKLKADVTAKLRSIEEQINKIETSGGKVTKGGGKAKKKADEIPYPDHLKTITKLYRWKKVNDPKYLAKFEGDEAAKKEAAMKQSWKDYSDSSITTDKVKDELKSELKKLKEEFKKSYAKEHGEPADKPVKAAKPKVDKKGKAPAPKEEQEDDAEGEELAAEDYQEKDL